MTEKMIEKKDASQLIESLVVQGDLSKLTPEQRVAYYRSLCESLGLNPLTRPFDYITLKGRLVLYARKDCAEQLRKINNISIEKPEIRMEGDWIIVTIVARDNTGRTDSDIGVVSKHDMENNFGNALMKAITKAKRRVTLSISGLGILDETETETIPDVESVYVADTGEIIEKAEMTWNKSQVDAAMFALGIDNVKKAIATLNLSNLDKSKSSPEEVIEWIDAYKIARQELPVEMAAEKANNRQ